MKKINFMDFKIEKLDAEKVTKIFKEMREELESHKHSYGVYPKKVFMYNHFINYMQDKTPVTKNNMIICISETIL